MGTLTFNGISTEDLGLVIQTPPTYTFPERDISTVHIPGRNGDLVIDNNCYKNVRRSYMLGMGFKKEDGAYSNNSSKILEWLTSARSHYARLQDTYDPTVYRMAMFNMSGSFTNVHDGAISFTAEFQCKPQRYLLSGEVEVTYNNVIENPSIYEALPMITISGLTGQVSTEDILMLNVKNGADVVSSVTMSKSIKSTVILDSEMQRVTDENQNDLSPYIGLNGKSFPVFKEGTTTLELVKYKSVDIQVLSYDSLLKKAQTIVKSEHKTHSALENQFQDKYSIPSYKSLVESKQETYSAEAVQSMVMDVQESYTFESFNEVLSQVGTGHSFTGSIDDNTYLPPWLELEAVDDKHVRAVAKSNGFYMVKNNDNKIRYIKNGDTIKDNISITSVTTIYYYPGSERNIDAGYPEMPVWLKFEIDYDKDGSPNVIRFKTNAEGYYWTDKTWFLGKPQWTYHQSTEKVTLNELFWDTSKKAFVPSQGLITSTTTKYTYAYLSELPQYEDITTKEERNGKTITKVVSKVYFEIEDLNRDLNQIAVKATEPGYYAYQINGKPEEGYVWQHKNKNDTIIVSTELNGTSSFTIMRIEQPPVYDNKDKKTWPDWLNNVPRKTEGTIIAPKYVALQVLEDGWYRESTVNMETEEETYGDWIPLTAGSYFTTKEYGDDYSIARVSKDPSTFEYVNDRVYTNEAGEMSQDEPAWLKADIFIEVIFGEDTDKITCHRNSEDDIASKELFAWTYELEGKDQILYTKTVWNPDLEDDVYKLENDQEIKIGSVATESQIRYTASVEEGKKAYYKWDSNSVWVSKENGQEILIASGISDTTFYYIESLPKYDGTYEDFGPYDLFDIEIYEDYSGNPSSLTFRVKENVEKYFRVNNNSDWINQKSGDVILTSKTMEPNTIRYLDLKSDVTEDVVIKYIPNWWVL